MGREDRLVERALNAGLEIAIERSSLEDARVLRPLGVDRPKEGEPPLGQGPRLVAAEHVDAPEVLDGLKLLDDDPLLRHPQGSP
ncbi:hypothetical protein D3C87_1053910 [compost metagenome]